MPGLVVRPRQVLLLESLPVVYEMRYTIIDARGTLSVTGPCHVLKMLVAACARMPATAEELLGHVWALDAAFVDYVASGLAVFDEHHPVTVTMTGEAVAPALPAVFRVTDAASRQASLQPHGAGAVVFNLLQRRIVQLHNTYAEVARKDRGRLRQHGRPVGTYYYYDLPSEWQIVP